VTGIRYPFQPLDAEAASLVEKETPAYGVLYEDKKAEIGHFVGFH